MGDNYDIVFNGADAVDQKQKLTPQQIAEQAQIKKLRDLTIKSFEKLPSFFGKKKAAEDKAQALRELRGQLQLSNPSVRFAFLKTLDTASRVQVLGVLQEVITDPNALREILKGEMLFLLQCLKAGQSLPLECMIKAR
jgi:hypothetical protein